MIVDPEQLEAVVTDEVGGSALFAARFRECAARALLLPRRDPRSRSPLWQQRMRSAQLLTVAAQYPEFPIVLETMRECLTDVFDLDGLIEVQRQLAARTIRLVEVETREPSPFAKSLLFGYVGAFVYEGDVPLAEKKAAALSLDAGLLAELLGKDGLRQLLDPEVIAATEADLQGLSEQRRATTAEQLFDLVRTAGPFTPAELAGRVSDLDLDAALSELVGARRAVRLRSPVRRWSPWWRTCPGCATAWACPCPPASLLRSRPTPAAIPSRIWCSAGPAPTDRSPSPSSPSGTAWGGPSSRRPAPTSSGPAPSSAAPSSIPSRGVRTSSSSVTPRCSP